jgi:hypothetical protein
MDLIEKKICFIFDWLVLHKYCNSGVNFWICFRAKKQVKCIRRKRYPTRIRSCYWITTNPLYWFTCLLMYLSNFFYCTKATCSQRILVLYHLFILRMTKFYFEWRQLEKFFSFLNCDRQVVLPKQPKLFPPEKSYNFETTAW